ncbi:pilus assembly PilX N-terminal domain-containing protein [uncultured Desulfosarcina sp.]|uniref:pilus assembly PilX family protein n=1 Tax=uncultured Desulfosarcina sp. TaxID=218289 RepID=UPI0029C6A665|nr:pilus assembly PilX N-terminal domain-containing protein [uncultured Desulfosarcina sp.]
MNQSVKKILSDERGSVIIAAVLILVTLTIMGIWASNTTVTEYQIASNDQFHKIAFTNADSGVYVTPKLVSKAINESAPQGSTVMGLFGFAFENNTDENALYDQILGYTDWDNGITDISMANDVYNDTIEVDIQRTRQQLVAGGGVEFASGAEGVGVGSTGGVNIYYMLDSIGPGPRQSVANVRAEYRKVLGIAGGL